MVLVHILKSMIKQILILMESLKHLYGLNGHQQINNIYLQKEQHQVTDWE